MEFIDVVESNGGLWEQAWSLYNASFPEHERRSAVSHAKAMKDSNFHTKAIVEDGDLLAILFYWTFGVQHIYIEHIAVEPRMRGRKIGSSVFRDFARRNPNATIILEIDPPLDDVSKRRLAFYEKLGFHNTGFIFRHPSYHIGGKRHDLLILSYPTQIQEDELEKFVLFLRSDVLAYID